MEWKGYSVRQNLSYLIHRMRQEQKSLLPMLILHIVLSSISAFYAPVLIKSVIEQIESGSALRSLVVIVAFYAGTMIVFEFSNGILKSQLWWRVLDLRMSFLKLVMRETLTMDYQKLENPNALDGYNRAMTSVNDEAKGIEGMTHSIVDLGILFLQGIIAAGIICTLNPLLLLLMAATVGVQFLPIDRTKRRDKKEVWDALSPFWRKLHYFNMVTKDFEYGKDIRLFRVQDLLYRKQCHTNQQVLEHTRHSRNLWLRCHTLLQVVQLLQEGILYAWLINSVLYHNLSIADFTLYIAAVKNFSTAADQFMWKYASMRNQSNEVNDFRRFIEYGEEQEENGLARLEDRKGDGFVFEHVSFRYEGQEQYALRDVSFTLHEGERLAVVGLNGAGKTTLIKLLCRLYAPTEGRILYRGIDIQTIDRREYFAQIAPVFQNVELYAYTLAENVSMQKLDSTDKERVREAVRQAGLGQKVESLPKEILTQMLKVLYDDGVDLSGGEKQKLSLARALYKEAELVILDEPTAALDALAEYEMYQNFDQFIGSRMAVYISHRLASTRFCDRIVLLSEGRLLESGTHEELLAQGGEYQRLFEMQAQYYTEEDEVSAYA